MSDAFMAVTKLCGPSITAMCGSSRSPKTWQRPVPSMKTQRWSIVLSPANDVEGRLDRRRSVSADALYRLGKVGVELVDCGGKLFDEGFVTMDFFHEQRELRAVAGEVPPFPLCQPEIALHLEAVFGRQLVAFQPFNLDMCERGLDFQAAVRSEKTVRAASGVAVTDETDALRLGVIGEGIELARFVLLLFPALHVVVRPVLHRLAGQNLARQFS